MEYARSLITGRDYDAVSLSYAQIRKLKLVCPVCHSPVFKRVREIPEERHFFCHYKGGSPDCELYRSEQYPQGVTKDDATPRGQEYEQFVSDIQENIRLIVAKSKLIHEEFDADVLDYFQELVAKYELRYGSAMEIEADAYGYLAEQFDNVDPEILRLLNVIAGFHRNSRSVFADECFLSWCAYIISEGIPDQPYENIVNVLVGNEARLDGLLGLLISALVCLYANRSVVWVASEFFPYQREILREIRSYDENACGSDEIGHAPRRSHSIEIHGEVGASLSTAQSGQAAQSRNVGNSIKGKPNAKQPEGLQTPKPPKPNTHATPGIKSSLNPAAAWPFPTGSRRT